MASVHHLQLCTTFVFWETCSFGFCTACFYYCFCWFCICMLLFIFLNLEPSHHYCIGFIWKGCLLYEIMPVKIEQWHGEIGNFNGCSSQPIVKLHLNLFDLLFIMFLVSFSIIARAVCFICFMPNHTFYFSTWLSTFSLYHCFLQQF